MKKLIDANVILRYLLGDYPQMSEEARKVIEDGAFTLPEVIAEVVYVLKGVYKIGRDEIGRTLIELYDPAQAEVAESHKETTLSGVNHMREIASLVHGKGGKIITNINVTLAWGIDGCSRGVN